MKGIVFTEFTEMIENDFGLAMLDEIIETSDLPSKGIYTSVGTYSHQEMVTLLAKFSELTNIPVPEALRLFGSRLFNRFFHQYPNFFEHHTTVFPFLESVESHIHTEVLKLYPNAQLPRFICSHVDSKTMIMEYHSDKHLEWLAIGLIEGALKQFGEIGEVKLIDSPNSVKSCQIQIQLK